MEEKKGFFKKIWRILMKRKWLTFSSIFVLIIVIMILRGGKATPLKSFQIARGDVVSEVTVTGTVKPTQSLDVAFEQSGRVSKIYVTLGQKVSQGDPLIALDSSDLRAQLAQAQAQYESQQAKLNQLQAGTRSQDLAIAQTALDNAQQQAQTSIDADYAAARNVLRDAYTKANDAATSQISSMFDANQATPRVTFDTSAAQAKIDAGSQYAVVQSELNTWSQELQTLTAESSQSDIDAALEHARTHINACLTLFSYLQDALNGSSLDATTLATYRASFNTGKAELITALTNITNQQQAISAQKTANDTAISAAQKQLDLKQAGSASQDIQYQQGQVDQAAAQVHYYQAQLAKRTLYAPFSGTVTKIPLNVGDIAQPNVTAISLIGSGAYQIETYIAESDIAKIKIGQDAHITLDAYGQGVIFDAKVVQVDLSATTLDGVATYKTILQFSQEDSRILAGMTANVTIESDQKTNVLYVPTRNVIFQDNKTYVELMANKDAATSTQTEFTAGLRGSDGRTEIVSGLQEGQYVQSD